MKYTFMLIVFLCAGACAAKNPDIIIDPKDTDMSQYYSDLSQCRQLSSQVEQKAGKKAVAGALAGGLIGRIIARPGSVRRGATLGVVSGSLRGAVQTRNERLTLTKHCLASRGYAVLN